VQGSAAKAVLLSWGLPILVALLTFSVQLPYFRLWFNFMDEGHMVQFADMVLNGGEFYRDATFYPLPGAFYFLVLIFKLFGASIVVSRWVVLIQFSLFVMLIFIFLRRVVSLPYAGVGVACMLLYRIWVFPHWHIYSYSTSSLLMLFASLLLLLQFFDTENRRTLAGAGFVFGLGVLCKQDYGAAALAAVVITLVAFVRSGPMQDRPPLAPLLVWFFLPAAAVGALTGLHYWRVGILDELLRFTVFNHFVGMSNYEYMSFPDLFPLFGQDIAYRTQYSLLGFMPGAIFTTDWNVVPTHPLFTDTPLYESLMKLFIFGPLVFLVGGGVRLLWRRRTLGSDGAERRRSLAELSLFVFCAGLVALVWLNKPQDYLHLAVLYWPLICLSMVYLHSGLKGRKLATALVIAVLLAPTGALVAYSARMVDNFEWLHTDLIPGERAGIWAKPSEAAMVEEIVAYMHENSGPDERVAAMPYFPIVNFLAERLGPHRSAYIVWPFPELPDRDERIVEGMEQTGTNLVIYNFTQFYSFSPVWEHAPILFEYLVDHFVIDRVFSHDAWGYKLVGLKRVDPADEPGGLRIIPENAEGLALSVVGDGPPRPVSPESRAAYVREMLWPFRRTIALRASTHGRSTVLSAPLSVPSEGGRLSSAVSVHPQWWFKLPPSWIRFSVAVRTDDGVEEVFEQIVSPTVHLTDRRWFDVDVSLNRWAGRDIVLEFRNEAERPRGETYWMGGWEVPLLLPPEEASNSANPSR
jgi:hypothetical protein